MFSESSDWEAYLVFNISQINALKYNGDIHRSWNVVPITRSGDELLFRGVFNRDIRHPELGLIQQGTISYEYFFRKCWFNVFRLHYPNDSFRNFYCNINMPPKLNSSSLNYIDLDIDLIVEVDFSYRIVDMNEFEKNAAIYGYPPEIRQKTLESVDKVVEMIKRREHPFRLEMKDFGFLDSKQFKAIS